MPPQARIRIALFVFFMPMAGALRAGDEPRPWRVLVLQTGDFYVPANLLQVQGMRSALTAGPHAVELRAESLDITRVELPELEPDILALLKKKDRGVAFDLIMPMGGEALEFAQRHRAELWPGVPIVFFSVAEETTRTLRLDAGATGVTMSFDVVGTLDLALRLQPSARQVVLIAGASEFDRGWIPGLEEATRRRADRLKAIFLVGQPLAALLDAVKRLPADSFVLFTTVFRDGAGQPYVSRNVLEQVALASSVPVYGIAETYFGHGMLGGSISGLEAHGRRAGEMALRVLGGESADTIPVQPPAPAVPMLDSQQLRRWGFSEGALPPGSVVLFKEPSFWDAYRGYALAAALVLLVQAGLIVALMLQRRRARRAERESLQQQAELAQASRLAAIGALTATIAHEINQPLGAILGNAEAGAILLESNPHDLEPVRQILVEIQNENHRASNVIRHVRSLLSKAPLEMNPSPSMAWSATSSRWWRRTHEAAGSRST